jgi:hypothetical protein
MLLGKPHTASDIYSPLFGPVMGFKSNAYSTVNPPTEIDAHRFGEKVNPQSPTSLPSSLPLQNSNH